MLGSSKIAYGTSNPPGSCADFVIGEFLKQIKNGVLAGDAHVFGIKRLVQESYDFDDSEIKTVAEFSCLTVLSIILSRVFVHSPQAVQGPKMTS